MVADIGSGTGLFSQLLLAHQYRVFGIEPNSEMRSKAEARLSSHPDFLSVDAAAEATGLDDHSVDCITAATAFHWFDKEKAKDEFGRILKPGGFCILLWNLRIHEASPLMGEYETLLNQYGTDYREIAAHKVQEEGIRQFFAPNTVQVASFPNQQKLDKSGFLGRLLSVSYLPEPEHPRYEAMIQAARSLFDKYQRDGYVEFFYHTKCYYGCFGESRSKK